MDSCEKASDHAAAHDSRRWCPRFGLLDLHLTPSLQPCGRSAGTSALCPLLMPAAHALVRPLGWTAMPPHLLPLLDVPPQLAEPPPQRSADHFAHLLHSPAHRCPAPALQTAVPPGAPTPPPGPHRQLAPALPPPAPPPASAAGCLCPHQTSWTLHPLPPFPLARMQLPPAL